MYSGVHARRAHALSQLEVAQRPWHACMCMQHEEVRTQDGVVTCRPSVIPTLTTTANSAARIVIWPRVHTLAAGARLRDGPRAVLLPLQLPETDL